MTKRELHELDDKSLFFSFSRQYDPRNIFIENYSPLAWKLTDVENWLNENNIDYCLTPREECTKHVFVETEYSKNEYEITGYDLFFLDEKDAVHFKLVWGNGRDE